MAQVTDIKAIEAVIDKIIMTNEKQVADFRAGRDKVFGFFVYNTGGIIHVLLVIGIVLFLLKVIRREA